MIFTSDNNLGKCLVGSEDLLNLQQIAGHRIADLMSTSGNELWLFPNDKDLYGDKIYNEPVFMLDGNMLITKNIMGFVGIGGTEVTIHSRFSSTYKSDFFMQYLLQKVFAINIFDLQHSSSKEDALDMAILLFPYFLQKALMQGLYREYRHIKYNDDRVRGTIDFNRHIRINYPFKNGKVSYNTREFRYDNSITQLIRHTIEYIKSLNQASFILFANNDIQSYVQTIIDATPSFRKGDLSKVMAHNTRPKIHPYYSEYRPLQRLCLQILRHEKISYGYDSKRIYGVLFDGAWLWEEYLSFVLKKLDFSHTHNKERVGGIQVYSNKPGVLRFPDYLHPEIIADAKYKRYYKKHENPLLVSIPGDDLTQMISYLHLTKGKIGVYICPRDDFEYPVDNGVPVPEDKWSLLYHRVGILKGFGGEIHVISLNIPQNCPDYMSFKNHMETIEIELERKLKKVILGEDEVKEYSYA